jgi:hypothetical protein
MAMIRRIGRQSGIVLVMLGLIGLSPSTRARGEACVPRTFYVCSWTDTCTELDDIVAICDSYWEYGAQCFLKASCWDYGFGECESAITTIECKYTVGPPE